MLDYTSSGFMGNIELLIKLNDMLNFYIINNLQNDLQSVDLTYKIKIEQFIKKFVFLLLNYTLKLIDMTSETLAKTNSILKDKLLKYSMIIILRINLMVQEQIKLVYEQNNLLKQNIETNHIIKREIRSKLDVILNQMKSLTPSRVNQPNQPNPVNQINQTNTTPISQVNQSNTPNLPPFIEHSAT